MEVGKQNKGLKKSAAEWAKASCLAHHEAVLEGKSGGGVSYSIANKTIMKESAFHFHHKLGSMMGHYDHSEYVRYSIG